MIDDQGLQKQRKYINWAESLNGSAKWASVATPTEKEKAGNLVER